jgi:hypothetical protein
MANEFSADIKQFIDQNIESLAQLETLLLLRRVPERGWDASEIAKTLYVPQELAAALLTDLCRRGLVKVTSPAGKSYAYSAAERVDKLVLEVAVAYQDRPVAIISLIYSKPLNKVQTFADAFRLRKEGLP